MTRLKRHKGYYAILFLSIFSFLTIAGAGLTFLHYNLEKKRVIKDISRDSLSILQVQKQLISGEFESDESNVKYLAFLFRQKASVFRNFVSYMLNEKKNYLAIKVLDEKGVETVFKRDVYGRIVETSYYREGSPSKGKGVLISGIYYDPNYILSVDISFDRLVTITLSGIDILESLRNMAKDDSAYYYIVEDRSKVYSEKGRLDTSVTAVEEYLSSPYPPPGVFAALDLDIPVNGGKSAWSLVSFVNDKDIMGILNLTRKKFVFRFEVYIAAALLLSMLGVLLLSRLRSFNTLFRLYGASFEQSASSIIITDPDGNIIAANNSVLKDTGYEPRELVGENTRILKSGHHGASFYREMWKTISGGDVWRGTFLNKRRNGTLVWARAQITPVKNGKGRIAAYLAIEDDVTEVKKNEDALKVERELLEVAKLEAEYARHEAERLNSVKTSFLANFSHEILTPINIINGYAVTLLEDEKNDDRRGKLERIIESGKNLQKLVSDILDFTRLEGNKYGMTIKEFSAVSVVNGVLDRYKSKARKMNLKFNVIFGSNIPGVFTGDERIIQKFLESVMDFAVASNINGVLKVDLSWKMEVLHIIITLPDCTLNDEELKMLRMPVDSIYKLSSKDMWRQAFGILVTEKMVKIAGGKLVIENTPRGELDFILRLPVKGESESAGEVLMDMNGIVNRWFEELKGTEGMLPILNDVVREMPFRLTELIDGVKIKDVEKIKQLSHSLKGVTGNLGMKEIFDLMSEINFLINEDSPDFGRINKLCDDLEGFSDFLGNFEFEGMEQDTVILTNKSRYFKKVRILTADDDEANRKITGAFLKTGGYETDFAVNGKEVLEMVGKVRYDLVLMDVHMPTVNGIDVVKKIREDKKYDYLKIIAVTGDISDNDIKRYMNAGFNDHIAKPVDRHLLLKKIEEFTGIGEADKKVIDEIIERLSASVRIFNKNHIIKVAEDISGDSSFLRELSGRIKSIAESYDTNLLSLLVEELKQMREENRNRGG